MFEDLLKHVVYPGDADIAKVTAIDLTQAFRPLHYGIGYLAWTNSPTTMFVRDPISLGASTLADARESLAIAAFHEGVHIKQFAKTGKRPQTYAQMMEFEQKAYAATAAWLASSAGKKVVKDAAYRASSQKDQQMYANAFAAEISFVTTKKPAAQRESEYKAWLLGANTIGGNGEKMLPSHTNLGDLYT